MFRKRYGFNFIFIIIIVVSLGLIGFFSFRYYKNKPLTFHLLFKTEIPPVKISDPLVMKGLEIGYVKDISIKGEYIDVEVLINYKFKKQIRKDCEFIIKKERFLGKERFIEVIPSKNQNSPLIKNGEEIYVVQKEGIWDKMGKMIKKDIKQIQERQQKSEPKDTH